MTRLPMPSLLRLVLIIIGVAVAYYLTGRAIFDMGTPPNGAVQTVWLPSGITVAALLLFGPFAAIGSFIGSIALDLKMGTPLLAALIVGVANAGSELLCYYLIIGRERRLFSIEDKRAVLRFVWAAALGSAVSAIIGVSAYANFGVIPTTLFWPILLTWFGSTTIGIVLITPFLVYAFRIWPSLGSRERYLEYAVVLVVLVIAALLWQGPAFTRNVNEPIVLIVILMFLWVAFRFPPAAMTLVVFSFAIASVGGAVLRLSHDAPEGTFVSIFSLQLMLGGLAVIGYLLDSMVTAQKRVTEALQREVLDRMKAEEQIRESEARYRNIFDHAYDIIYLLNLDGTIRALNPAFVQMTGWSVEAWIGKPFTGLIHPDDLSIASDVFQKMLADEPTLSFRMRIAKKSGEYFDADTSLAPLGYNMVAGAMGIVRDVTERKRAEEKLYHLATTDSLTGVANRREFSTILTKEVDRVKRYALPLSLVMYDLDYFKRVNDTFGHDVGDYVLQTVTDLVKENIRVTDTVARWGGEEFMVLMPQSDIQAAKNAAEKIRCAIAEHIFDKVGKLTVSFGVVAFEPQDDLNALLKRVDDALYQAKEHGRNRVETLVGNMQV